MGNSLVVLAIVTQAGMINQDLKFNTIEECEKARTNIKYYESFCYQPPVVDIDSAMEQMGEIMQKMKQQLDAMKEPKPNV